jgi:hypothetical protein
MNNFEKFRRVEKIVEKLKDPSEGMLLRIDSDSWSDAEKALFRRVDEVVEEYERTGNELFLATNMDLVYKNIEVMRRRISEMYCWMMPTAIAGYTAIDREVVDYFFQLHFRNFEADLMQCIQYLQTWTESDFEEFLCDLKKNGPFYYLIPRGFNECNSKKGDKKGNSKGSAVRGDEEQEE